MGDVDSASRGHGRRSWRIASWRAIAVGAVVLAACGAAASGDETLSGQSISRVAIPGTVGGTTSTAADGTVTALNCVGTGNDVIAKKPVGDEWLLLESGAGGRGAGIIVSRDPSQRPPSRLSVTGRCPRTLIDSVG